MKTNYPTNLTDIPWQAIEKIIKLQERTRKHCSMRNYERYSLHQQKWISVEDTPIGFRT